MEKSNDKSAEDTNVKASRGKKRSQSSGSSSEETAEPLLCDPVTVVSLDCPIPDCEEQLSSVLVLDGHLVEKHKIYPQRCVAKRCKYNARKVSKLREHIRTKHNNLGSWECSICSEEFPQWIQLKYHNFDKHERGKFKCNFENCPFTDVHRQPVVDHFRETHHRSTKKARIAKKNVEKENVLNENPQTV